MSHDTGPISDTTFEDATVRVIPVPKTDRTGKLADAELHFSAGLLTGLKLMGFAVWQERARPRSVTFPARAYTVNGERRSFALLRAIAGASATEAVRTAILVAYATYEEHAAQLEARDQNES